MGNERWCQSVGLLLVQIAGTACGVGSLLGASLHGLVSLVGLDIRLLLCFGEA